MIVRKSLISTEIDDTSPVRDSSFANGSILFGRIVAKMIPSVTIFFSNALPE